MLANYLKIAWRNLFKNKLYTVLNVLGLGSGMAATILIGLWLNDELSANHYHPDYERVALLKKNRTYNGEIFTETSNPIPLGAQLRNLFPDDFESVVVSSYGGERSLRVGDNTVVRRGLFMEDGGFDVMGLDLIEGSKPTSLDPNAIYISETVNTALFGDKSGLGEILRLDENLDAEIVGIFKDLPSNATYRSTSFYASLTMYGNLQAWVKNSMDDWSSNSFPIYVKIAPNADFETISAKIENTLNEATSDLAKPQLFLHPMSKWHLYPQFKDGVAVGSKLKNVWLFGIVGLLILLLASINFMNLSTARSAQRAKEIGVRKAIGSERSQLVKQFFTETYLVVLLSVITAIILVILLLPFFNTLANENLEIPWRNPLFGLSILVFGVFTGFLAGSYPAMYLSSFNPIAILKGTKVSGKKESRFRQALVVLQFGISIVLIIGTLIVYQQIDLGKNRAMGYEQNGLIYFQKRSDDLRGHHRAMEDELLKSGAILAMTESSGPLTEMWHINSDFDWKGKDPESSDEFIYMHVNHKFGETVQWKIKKGRDFSDDFKTDAEGIILNEAAVTQMDFEEPLNEIVRFQGENLKVLGVSENLVMDSPFETVKPTVFLHSFARPFVTLRLNPDLSISESLARIDKVLRGFSPNGDFNIKFVSNDTSSKFAREEQVAKLASSLSLMAIFISFLGIFGLSSFMAEQRRKEIGVRKILGASVTHIINLMSRDFVTLIVLSCLFAFPLAYYLMNDWLSGYELKIDISFSVFVLVGIATILVTLLTVSFRSLKAALMNPVESLRNE